MNLRTLNKENSIHMLVLGSMLLSWGVTSFYFERLVPNEVVESLCNFLLMPVSLIDNILSFFTKANISGNPLGMFFALWITYMLPAFRLYPVFMIKNHQVSDLKSWYQSRYGISSEA